MSRPSGCLLRRRAAASSAAAALARHVGSRRTRWHRPPVAPQRVGATSPRRVVPFTAASSSSTRTVSPWSARYEGSRSGAAAVPSTRAHAQAIDASAGRSPVAWRQGGSGPPVREQQGAAAAMMKSPRDEVDESPQPRGVLGRSRSSLARRSRRGTLDLPAGVPRRRAAEPVLTRKRGGAASRSIVSSAPITACACASARRIGCARAPARRRRAFARGAMSRSLTGLPERRRAARGRASPSLPKQSSLGVGDEHRPSTGVERGRQEDGWWLMRRTSPHSVLRVRRIAQRAVPGRGGPPRMSSAASMASAPSPK